MHVSRRFLVLALVALIWGTTACGASTAPPRAVAAPAEAAATPAPTVRALATDQACTRRAAAGATLQALKWRAEDLPAMTLPKSALSTAVRYYSTDWTSSYGFMDNVELPRVQTGPTNLCAINRTYGRIVGFSRGFIAAQTVWTANHLFFTPTDAAAWLRAYVAGMKALPGHRSITSVRVSSLATTLGPGAVRVVARCANGCTLTHVLFQRGSVVGSVWDGHKPGVGNVINVAATAKALASRIVSRAASVNARGPVAEDVTMQLSAGLPKAALGARYAKLAWDWLFGGCWDVAEAATQTSSAAEAKAYRAAASRYGQLMYCRAMYAPATTEFLNGVQRVFTGGTLYTTAAGADGSMTYAIAQWQARAGRTIAGTAYGKLSRPWMPALGDRVVALQQRAGTVWSTRVLIRHGAYVAVATLNAKWFSGMTTDVRRWAVALDQRVTKLQATHTF
jgi:hypothetical protein